MCDPVSIGLAAVSAATSIYGGIQSAHAQQAQSQAIADQNRATQLAQNEAFTTRNQAALQQTAAQSAASQQSLQDRNTAALQMRQNQMDALKNYQDTINAENAQATALRQTGDAAAQDLLTKTNAPTLADAQTQRQQQAAALLAPRLPQGPGPTDPAGNDAATGDLATGGALARRTAEAATNIRDYGSRIAAVGSYEAPVQQVGLAITGNRTGIMPAQAAEQLLRAGSTTRLLPSQVDYRAATGMGQAQDLLLQSRGQNALDAASLSYGNATDIANLRQSDADTIAANISAQAQANAKAKAAQAGIIQGIGRIGLYGAGAMGGYGGTGDLLGSQGPVFGTAADQSIAAGGPPLAPGGGPAFLSRIF
jgi:hypothetical protein